MGANPWKISAKSNYSRSEWQATTEPGIRGMDDGPRAWSRHRAWTATGSRAEGAR